MYFPGRTWLSLKIFLLYPGKPEFVMLEYRFSYGKGINIHAMAWHKY